VGRWLTQARLQRQLTQKVLAEACGLAQSDISKIESGERWPTLPQLANFARQLSLPMQWFLSGQEQPGIEFVDFALELQRLGAVDLLVPDARVPGAFRLPEQVLARVVTGDSPDPRIIEAVPALLAWNACNPHLLAAFARATGDRRAAPRLAWLGDVGLTIHKGQGFPGGLVDSLALSKFVAKIKPCPKPDDLGHPADVFTKLPPVSRRWNICYEAILNTFYQRANRLLALRAKGA
jgi:transcriptional regulator with XRE-family HTH domain